MKRFITGPGHLDCNHLSYMDLLKNIKMVRMFGLFCQYPVAITRTSIKFLSPFFQMLSGAKIETNLEDARATFEGTNSEEDDLVVSLVVKNLHTNLTVEEVIEILLMQLYSSDEVPENPRSAMKTLLNFHIKCNKMWYTQSDRLAMGASLAVILATLCMKLFEKNLAETK